MCLATVYTFTKVKMVTHKRLNHLIVLVNEIQNSYTRFVFLLSLTLSCLLSGPIKSQDSDPPANFVDNLNNLSEKFKNTDSDSSYYYANAAFQKAEEIDYTYGIIEARNNLGEYYLDQGKYLLAKEKFLSGLSMSEQADIKYLKAISKAKLAAYFYFTGAYDSALTMLDIETRKVIKEEDKQEYAKLLNLVSYIYSRTGSYYDALQARYEVLNIRLDLGDKDEIAKSFNALGDFFKRQNDYSKALEYYFNSHETCKKSNNLRGEGISLTNIAEIYYLLEDYDRALDFHLRALDKKKENGVLKEIGISYNGLGLVYNAKKEYEKSLSYLNRAETLFEGTASLPLYAETLYAIAEVNYNRQAYDSAAYYWKETEEIGQEIKNFDLLLGTYQALSRLYLNVDGSDDGLRYYYNKYINLADSLRLKENKNEILKLQAQFEDASTQEKIDKISNEKSQTEQELAKTEVQRRNLVFLFCAALILMFLVMFYYRKSNKKSVALKKNNNIIKEQNNHLKELNKQLGESKVELEKINATKDKLFAIISHDVRSPLSSLSGLLEVISDQPEEIQKTEINDLFQNLKNKVNMVDSFLNNLLGWARVQSNEIKVNSTSICLKELIHKIIHLYADQAEQKRILIKTDLQLDKDVYVDKDMLEFVIRNLLANAIKFTYPESNIEINTRKVNGFGEISVRDYGIGMTEDEVNHLFDLKQQVSKKGTFSEKGTGLGLILTKEFIERNHGALKVESKKNNGSKFIFTLPLSIEKNQALARYRQDR